MTASIDTLRQRAAIIQTIRRFFIENGFLEVDTPALVSSPGMEPYLNAFETAFHPEFTARSPSRTLYLPTSPEFHMKRLLSRGSGDIFQICRAFRNGETGQLHQPEFTMLEWYRAGKTYSCIMEDVENLFLYTVQKALATTFICRNDRRIDLTPPWQRMTVNQAWKTYTGIDLETCETAAQLLAEGRRLDVPHLKPDDSRETLYYKIFLDRIEPYLGMQAPLFLHEYPADMAALARLKPDDPSVALRFELYIDGIELCNAFDELIDPAVQKTRCETARALQVSLGKKPFPLDEQFIAALEQGLPPCAGIALGIDRMIMLLLNKRSIQDILAFPFPD
jgi:elongation factor P--(R)-beta-lysine ligase